MTAEGRRSARLTSVTRTGDDNGTVDGDGTTQSRIAFNIREERRVLDRLRTALPPPVTLDSLDFPETGGSTLMGDGWEAYYNEPLVRLANTTEVGNDDDSTVDGGTTQGTVEGPLTLEATVGLTDGHGGAAPLTVPAGPLCVLTLIDATKPRGARLTASSTAASVASRRTQQSTAEDCRWWHTTSSGTWSRHSTTPRRRQCSF